MAQNVFQRYEIKYVLTKEQYALLLTKIKDKFVPDKFFRTDVCSLYYDTSDFLLARRSIEKPAYKEKFRLRSYGVVKDDAPVFVEIKRKYDDVVYKRRIKTTEKVAVALAAGKKNDQTQIGQEIGYFLKLYGQIEPKIFVSYAREAYTAKDDQSLRLTFDQNVLWRDYDLSMHHGIYGTPILPPGSVLMELKTAGALPLWLVEILSQNKIYKSSFSKYGAAYQQAMAQVAQGGKKIA